MNSISTQRLPVPSFLIGMTLPSGVGLIRRGIRRDDYAMWPTARRFVVVIACDQIRDRIGQLIGKCRTIGR
jgi:hypothetical protein